ncbi:poly(R)-hydroxyalkanoic acid synthase subunit PhaE [Alkalilimnicola ehrlichii]|uniref:poly(R)-hydroxyalkanoic acid synthase subunit PhaE n=1 Tax=Alkalilimnicola ehrlichii TaxID=351052 RepID=UPI002162EE5A|nr:poly(R)-hydroxyalkanoic acid synthase subunit PhaE [Alkalilimnicola ehrlichii]
MRTWSHSALRTALSGPVTAQSTKTADANKAAQEYLAAQQDYLALLQQLGERVLAAGKTRLEQDPKPAGIQEVYSAWLEATESVYEEYVFSEEYTRSLGRLSHATARLIRHTQDSLEGVLKLLGLPTRTDMLSTQRRLHEIRRQQHACAEHVAADEFLALKNEVQALRQELQNLKRAQADNEEHE